MFTIGNGPGRSLRRVVGLGRHVGGEARPLDRAFRGEKTKRGAVEEPDRIVVVHLRFGCVSSVEWLNHGVPPLNALKSSFIPLTLTPAVMLTPQRLEVELYGRNPG